MKTLLLYVAILLSVGALAQGQGQVRVKGTVYDSTHIYPVEAVSVMSTGGRGTMTDSLGRYQLDVQEKDSIWFSFLGKPTVKYPVLKIPDATQFDIALTLKVSVMKEVRIRSRYYKEDSVQNRLDYAKAFNYRKPTLKSAAIITGTGVGLDINEIARMFQFRKNKSMQRFQQRLIEEERQKFVDRRFNRGLVRRLTELDGELLEKFMLLYRPDYEFCLLATEYDFQMYIKSAGEDFKKTLSTL